jgi:hypothetical protein
MADCHFLDHLRDALETQNGTASARCWPAM